MPLIERTSAWIPTRTSQTGTKPGRRIALQRGLRGEDDDADASGSSASLPVPRAGTPRGT